MLADSLTSSTGWIVSLVLIGTVAILPGCLARFARRLLPPDRRARIPLEPLAFGISPRVRRSPRHAVALHRPLITSVFVLALGLLLIPFAAAIRSVGVEGLLVAILFAGPALLVALHAKTRGRDS